MFQEITNGIPIWHDTIKSCCMLETEKEQTETKSFSGRADKYASPKGKEYVGLLSLYQDNWTLSAVVLQRILKSLKCKRSLELEKVANNACNMLNHIRHKQRMTELKTKTTLAEANSAGCHGSLFTRKPQFASQTITVLRMQFYRSLPIQGSKEGLIKSGQQAQGFVSHKSSYRLPGIL